MCVAKKILKERGFRMTNVAKEEVIIQETKTAFSKKAKKLLKKYAPTMMAIAIIAAMSLFTFNPALADFSDGVSASTVTKQLEKIIKTIGGLIGALLIVVGAIKFAMAYSDGDGPGQKNAILFLASGAGVIVVVVSGLIGTVLGWVS